MPMGILHVFIFTNHQIIEKLFFVNNMNIGCEIFENEIKYIESPTLQSTAVSNL